MKTQNFNIKQIAEKTKVSIATISRALNHETRSKVAPDTLRRIEKVLRKYPYTPNIAAKHMRRTLYKTIGVLFPHHPGILSSDYYSEILTGTADRLLESDYSMKMILIKPGKSDWDYYDFQHGEGVDGLVMTYYQSLFKEKSIFDRLNIPCVVINNVEKNAKARFVAGDHFSGGRMAAEYLLEKGHRRIAVFTGKSGAPDVRARLQGFQSYLKERKIPAKESSIFDVDFKEDKAYLMTDQLLAERPGYTAVFCVNDAQAHGVLRRLKDLNVKCPDHFSVMGYDDDGISAYSAPPLTTVNVPVYELARKAAGDLLEQLEKKSEEFYEPVYLPVSIVERDSVAQLN